MAIRKELVKELVNRIRIARKFWESHDNRSTRRERDRALVLYQELTPGEREEIPQELRVWLRYRSEKYFGDSRTPKGTGYGGAQKQKKAKKLSHAPAHSVAFRRVDSPVGPLVILSSKKGISGLYFGHRIERSSLPGKEINCRFLDKAEKELREYFSGGRTTFEVRLDSKGSAFQRSAWTELLAIPYGETISYGEQARNMGDINAVRAVGAANGANPVSIIIPCHRVIGKSGDLTGFGGGVDIKRKLLAIEGHGFDFD